MMVNPGGLMPKVILTPAVVAGASCPNGKRKMDLFDTYSRGLMLEVRCSGGKTYYLRYSDTRGRVRQYRLADADEVSLTQARVLLDRARNRLAMGEDPAEQRVVSRQVPTFAEFVEQRYLPFARHYKRSCGTDVSLLNNHLLPKFGRFYLDEITTEHVFEVHRQRKAAGAAAGSANRLVILLRYVFNLAIKWDTPGVKKNPAKGVRLLEENNHRERYLSPDEAQRLYDAVCRSDNAMLKYIIPMLILTGARKRELLDAKWEDFDQERRLWRVPLPKSGRARHVPLSDGALTLLASIPRVAGCVWPFANPNTGKPFVSIYYGWDTARRIAGLPEVRIHDLRHSFASMLINQGRSLYEVQRILGHTQIKTTQRYSHLSNVTLLEAVNVASSEFMLGGSQRLAVASPHMDTRHAQRQSNDKNINPTTNDG
jgi:integrase